MHGPAVIVLATVRLDWSERHASPGTSCSRQKHTVTSACFTFRTKRHQRVAPGCNRVCPLALPSHTCQPAPSGMNHSRTSQEPDIAVAFSPPCSRFDILHGCWVLPPKRGCRQPEHAINRQFFELFRHRLIPRRCVRGRFSESGPSLATLAPNGKAPDARYKKGVKTMRKMFE